MSKRVLRNVSRTHADRVNRAPVRGDLDYVGVSVVGSSDTAVLISARSCDSIKRAAFEAITHSPQRVGLVEVYVYTVAGRWRKLATFSAREIADGVKFYDDRTLREREPTPSERNGAIFPIAWYTEDAHAMPRVDHVDISQIFERVTARLAQ